MNLIDSVTKGLDNAFQYVLIGVIGSIAYLSFGIASFWSAPNDTVYVDWGLHQTSLYLAFCGVGGWFLQRLALAVYWIGGDDMRHRWRHSIREYSALYPPHGHLRSLIDKLDDESRKWEEKRKFSFMRTLRLLVRKAKQPWDWADTWNSAIGLPPV